MPFKPTNSGIPGAMPDVFVVLVQMGLVRYRCQIKLWPVNLSLRQRKQFHCLLATYNYLGRMEQAAAFSHVVMTYGCQQWFLGGGVLKVGMIMALGQFVLRRFSSQYHFAGEIFYILAVIRLIKIE